MRFVHVFFFIYFEIHMKNIHIGSIIREKLEESGLSIAEFATKINRTRTTVYDIFNRKSIDIDLLLCISEVLDYNFLEEVYIEKDESTPQTKCRYVIGIEVSEQQLHDTTIDPHQIVLKILD